MQLNRLLEIVYILLSRKKTTAKELSEHFDVSVRTIYRDIDKLSVSGVPIYTEKGKGGGISILDNFVLDKGVFSEEEQLEIISSLESIKNLKLYDNDTLIEKMKGMFNQNTENWIEIDFSSWGNSEEVKQKFNLIKSAIKEKKLVHFKYFNVKGENTKRIVEPLKLAFKNSSWYLYGYCRLKKDYRMFKLSRIKNIKVIDTLFTRIFSKDIFLNKNYGLKDKVEIVLKIDISLSYRVYDEFDYENIELVEKDYLIVRNKYVEDSWLYSYIMSFEEYAEVLEPIYIRNIIKEKAKKIFEKYL